nr:TSUP family transporter [Paenibacillus turpanensis]
MIGAGFLAAFIDSIVGGGGLISLPALLLAGLPPGIAIGTNKLGGTFSSLTSTLSFLRSGKIHLKLAMSLFGFSFVGSAIGSYIITLLPSAFLKPMVIVLLALVTIYTLFKKNWGKESTYTDITTKKWVLSAVIAFIIGFYDGFFGPGTGSFLLFAFLLLGFDFVTAAGNARMLNFASNIASLLTFIALKHINFYYGLPMAVAMIAGAWIGSRFAIRNGSTFVKPLFITMSTLLIGKQIWDLLIR